MTFSSQDSYRYEQKKNAGSHSAEQANETSKNETPIHLIILHFGIQINTYHCHCTTHGTNDGFCNVHHSSSLMVSLYQPL